MGMAGNVERSLAGAVHAMEGKEDYGRSILCQMQDETGDEGPQKSNHEEWSAGHAGNLPGVRNNHAGLSERKQEVGHIFARQHPVIRKSKSRSSDLDLLRFLPQGWG